MDLLPGHEPLALDTVEAFHPQKKKWERLAPMNFPRCSTSSIVIRDRLLVVGGVNQVDRSSLSPQANVHDYSNCKKAEHGSPTDVDAARRCFTLKPSANGLS